jgi:hypothetical protein
MANALMQIKIGDREQSQAMKRLPALSSSSAARPWPRPGFIRMNGRYFFHCFPVVLVRAWYTFYSGPVCTAGLH